MPLSAQEALMSDPRADVNKSEGRCSCLSEFSGIQEKPGATSTDWTGGSLDTSRMLSLMLLIRRNLGSCSVPSAFVLLLQGLLAVWACVLQSTHHSSDWIEIVVTACCDPMVVKAICSDTLPAWNLLMSCLLSWVFSQHIPAVPVCSEFLKHISVLSRPVLVRVLQRNRTRSSNRWRRSYRDSLRQIIHSPWNSVWAWNL